MKLKIDKYTFGRMVIGGKLHTSDFIIHPDGHVQDNWWRSQGHLLLPDDLTNILNAAPDTLIIGTGASGLMLLSENLQNHCKQQGINILASPTAEAVSQYNRAIEYGDMIAACFHLTC